MANDATYYDTLVREGRQEAKSQWKLGDLALSVVMSYKEGKLQQYAEDVGVPYNTLSDYRRVAGVYEIRERSRICGWAIHRVFATEDDRAELVQRKWSYADARALVGKRREAEAAEQERREIAEAKKAQAAAERAEKARQAKMTPAERQAEKDAEAAREAKAKVAQLFACTAEKVADTRRRMRPGPKKTRNASTGRKRVVEAAV